MGTSKTLFQFILKILIVPIFGLILFCSPPNLNNPNDPFSSEYGKNSLLLYLIQNYLNAKEIIVPDAIAVMLNGQGLGNGLRVYRVDPEVGVVDEFVQIVSPLSTSAFPGNQPSRIAVPRKTRNIIYVNGRLNRRVTVLRYDENRTLSLRGTTLGSYDDTTRPFLNQIRDSNFFFLTAAVPNASTDQIHRWLFDPASESFTESNSGNLPFGVSCSAVSLRQIGSSEKFLLANTFGTPNGIQMYNYVDGSIAAIGTHQNLGATLSTSDDTCLIEKKNWFYQTNATTSPISGYTYSLDGTYQTIPGSPFTPNASFANLNVDSNSRSSLMTVNPDGTKLAIVYNSGTGGTFTVMDIEQTTGTLTPSYTTNVGNAPSVIHWDPSGKFIYFKSNTGGTTNLHQLEYFTTDANGFMQRGVNSPIVLGPMGSTPPISDITSIPIYK